MKFIDKLEPADVIAILAFIATIIANWKGVSIMIPASINIIIGFYFGHRASRWDKK
jgi:hypothetical protein